MGTSALWWTAALWALWALRGGLGQATHFEVGVSQLQGRRPYQEDRENHLVWTAEGKQVRYFGVFDGHGGSQASVFTVSTLHRLLQEHNPDLVGGNVSAALHATFTQLDKNFLARNEPSGSTALVGVAIDNTLWVANVGDCRGVLSRAGTAVPLSVDHKPNRPDELQRIRDAGSDAMDVMGTWRVEGTLAMSRAIGDRHLKHVVIADPEIKEFDLDVATGKDEFLVFASDGLWDVLSNQDVVDILHLNPSLHNNPKRAAETLAVLAYQLGSLDNITVQVVKLADTLTHRPHTEL